MSALGKIGKYELLKSLAVGGMAEVFLARQTGVQGFEKVLVIKRILPNLANQERFVNMFLDEARLAARFNHPNVVQIYDLGQDEDFFFIAMEYIHGEDIKSIVRRCAKKKKRIPIEHVVKIFTGVLDGLQYAHKQVDLDGQAGGVVHRDVSPHNIIVSFEGGVKLVDFGIAKARSEISTTIPGRVKGKHAYMSPEQCQGKELDGRSDVFSAGIVMYELLTWTRLFKRKSDIDTLRAVVSGEIRPPRSIRPEIDPELESIVYKSLASHPDERFQSAQEMQIALEDFLVEKGLKSNSALIGKYMSDLFSDKLEARTKALQHARAPNLEGAVLSAGDEGPDLVAFLNMFFDDSSTSGDSTSGSTSSPSSEISSAPEFTPSSDYTPAKSMLNEGQEIPRREALLSDKQPHKAPPPKPPPGMDLLHSTPPVREVPVQPGAQPGEGSQVPEMPGQREQVTDSFPDAGHAQQPQPESWPPPEEPFDPMAGERLPGDPDPYSDELMPSGKKGKGFIVLVFLVLAALAGGLIYMFRDTEQTTNAPETGRVLIKSVPSGADVYFNDARLPSQTPTEVARVEPNVEHTLKVTLPSLPAWEKKFTLTDTTKPLKFTAVLSEEEAEKVRMSGKPIIAGVPGKGKGSIRIVSKPRKALVYFDGIDTRKRTPVTLRGVSAGLDHVVMLEKNGFKPTYERLHLEDGEEKKVDLALDKGADNLSGRILVHVESEPEGASVKVNDYPLRNKTPMAVKLLVKGASDLEVDLKGYKPFSVKVRPVPGVDLTFFAKLKK